MKEDLPNPLHPGNRLGDEEDHRRQKERDSVGLVQSIRRPGLR